MIEHSPRCEKLRVLHERLRSAFALKWPNYCTTCNGLGGRIYFFDPSPAGVSLGAGWMEDFDPCPDCLEQGICPRCGAESDSFFEEACVCTSCGWDSEQADHDHRSIFLTDADVSDCCQKVAAIHAIPPTPECFCYEDAMYDEYRDLYDGVQDK